MTLLTVLLWIAAGVLSFFSCVAMVRASKKVTSTAGGVGALAGGLLNLFIIGVVVAAAIVVGAL